MEDELYLYKSTNPKIFSNLFQRYSSILISCEKEKK